MLFRVLCRCFRRRRRVERGGSSILVLTLIAHFAVRERHVLVANHVSDLSLHCDQKQRDKVHDEYGPKDRYVEDGKERAKDRDE